MSHPLDWSELTMCARCHAGPNEQCRTSGGMRATRPHASRTEAVARAYYDGYDDGTKDAVANPDWARRWAGVPA